MGSCGDLIGAQVISDGKGEFADHLHGIRSDDGRTEDHAFVVGNDFDEAITEIAGVTAGHDIEWSECDVDFEVTAETIIFGESD